MTRGVAKTPVRGALKEDSNLQPLVQDGLGALEKSHHNYFDASIRADFADSLDIDKALRKGREHENRWDYLLGHASSGQVIAVEPHTAKQDEITTLIRKREAAREQLRDHLRDGAKIAKWLWVATGKVHFADTEKEKLRLDQKGIEFVGKVVMPKHLPASEVAKTAPGAKSSRRGRR